MISVTEVITTVIGGTKCPNCKDNGALFHYKEGEISSHPEEFYLCEGCCKTFDKNLILNSK